MRPSLPHVFAAPDARLHLALRALSFMLPLGLADCSSGKKTSATATATNARTTSAQAPGTSHAPLQAGSLFPALFWPQAPRCQQRQAPPAFSSQVSQEGGSPCEESSA
jgi:hypothetical protein